MYHSGLSMMSFLNGLLKLEQVWQKHLISSARFLYPFFFCQEFSYHLPVVGALGIAMACSKLSNILLQRLISECLGSFGTYNFYFCLYSLP